eukprot:m51a1_g6203 putative rasrelated protein (576) ;mRNA; r:131901-134283
MAATDTLADASSSSAPAPVTRATTTLAPATRLSALDECERREERALLVASLMARADDPHATSSAADGLERLGFDFARAAENFFLGARAGDTSDEAEVARGAKNRNMTSEHVITEVLVSRARAPPERVCRFLESAVTSEGASASRAGDVARFLVRRLRDEGAGNLVTSLAETLISRTDDVAGAALVAAGAEATEEQLSRAARRGMERTVSEMIGAGLRLIRADVTRVSVSNVCTCVRYAAMGGRVNEVVVDTVSECQACDPGLRDLLVFPTAEELEHTFVPSRVSFGSRHRRLVDALLLGTHPRAGAASPVSLLPPALVRRLALALGPEPVTIVRATRPRRLTLHYTATATTEGECPVSPRRVEAKVALLGDSGAGKSAIALRFVKNVFVESCESTIGACFMVKHMRVDDAEVKLNLWDTAGQERFRALTPMYYREAEAVLIVFDSTRPRSWESAISWGEELSRNISEDVVVVVVAAKMDLYEALPESVRPSTLDSAREYAAQHGGLFYTTSAKDNSGIDQMFGDVAKAIAVKRALSPYEPRSPRMVLSPVAQRRGSGNGPNAPPAKAAPRSSCWC